MSLQSSYSLQPPIGQAGQLDRYAPHTLLTMKNTEASASMRFGIAVKRKGSATTDLDAVLPAAESDKVLGMVVREQVYARTYTTADGDVVGNLDSTGLVPGTLFNVATQGRMLVHCRTGATAGQGVWIRAVSDGAPEYLGAVENADDLTDTIDCTTQAKFETSCAADGLAWITFDFRNI